MHIYYLTNDVKTNGQDYFCNYRGYNYALCHANCQRLYIKKRGTNSMSSYYNQLLPTTLIPL